MTRIYKRYAPDRDYVLFEGDCHSLLRKIPDESIDITVTSPPYCMGKEYETTKDPQDFIQEHERIFPEIVRITKDGGSICWQVGYHVKNGITLPLDYLVYKVLEDNPHIKLRNRIVWQFGHGLHSKNRFSGRHEVIMWFTKGDDYSFDLDSVRIPQKYPGKKHYKGDKKGEYSGNPLGKNPSDVWEIPNVKAKHVEKTAHPCQFPIALAQRLIRGLCPRHGVVFDPFMGSGTSGVAAIVEKRRFVGSEIKNDYWNIAKERCKKALKKEVRIRPINKPILVPDKNTSVAMRPACFE